MNRTRRGSFRGKVSHNATQQRSKAANYGHLRLPKGINVFKEEPGGRIALDLLPYFVTDPHHPDRNEEFEIAVEGSLWYRRPYKLHRSIGTDNASLVCPTSIGKKCPICETRAKQLAAGVSWEDAAMKAMRPSDRNLYYTVPRGSKKYEERPYLWDISQFLFQEALNNELEENEEFGDFPDLENGLTLRIRFSEEKFLNNSFAKTSRIDFEQRDYAYEEDLIKQLPSLDDVLDVKDYSEVERLFFENGGDGADTDGEASETDEQDDAPAKSLARPRSDTVTILHRLKATQEPSQPAMARRREPEPDTTDDDLDEAQQETVTRSVTIQRRQASTTSTPAKDKPKIVEEGECPSGYRFGVDVDTKPECEDCPVWGDCMDARDKAA